jgi:chromosome segregation ATPase
MSVEKAEAVVAQLEQKRAACMKHGTELQDERANVALDAHTGDAKARQRLNEINSEIAVHASELASLDAAMRAGARWHIVLVCAMSGMIL